MRSSFLSLLPTLCLCSAVSAAAFGQTTMPGTDGTAQPPQTIPAAKSDTSSNSTYATGQPLAGTSKEGFWGHINPFARKKWVNRQIDPIKDRTNELDQLQAKNANDIRDVDTRSQTGINHALASASTADQHAGDAKRRADSAYGVATDAGNRAASLSGTIDNLDQYQTVSSAPVIFAAGRTTLGPKGKAQLDGVASKLANEKGYIIEVQGYGSGGVQTSQAMADSVVRYLITEHQVPIYRIYRTGLGKNTDRTTGGPHSITNGVVVNLMHNSLATMSKNNAPAAPSQQVSGTLGVSNPDSAQ